MIEILGWILGAWLAAYTVAFFWSMYFMDQCGRILGWSLDPDWIEEVVSVHEMRARQRYKTARLLHRVDVWTSEFTPAQFFLWPFWMPFLLLTQREVLEWVERGRPVHHVHCPQCSWRFNLAHILGDARAAQTALDHHMFTTHMDAWYAQAIEADDE